MAEKLPRFETNALKCAAIVCVEANEPLRDDLYKALERNPLLRHRIYWLKQHLSRGRDVLRLMEVHTRRVGSAPSPDLIAAAISSSTAAGSALLTGPR